MSPAHFVLSLVLLRPFYWTLREKSDEPWGVEPNLLDGLLSSHAPWVTAALLTTLLAARPIALATRPVDRCSLPRVAGSMLGLGYLNTLLSTVYVANGEVELGFVLVIALFGLLVAGVFTLPFMLLDLPVLSFVDELDGPARFDSRDRLLRLVGVHSLTVSVAVVLVVWVFSSTFLSEPLGLVSTALLAAAGLGLVVRSELRIRTRDAFVERVRRGEVEGYGVEPLGDSLEPPALTVDVERFTVTPRALFFFDHSHVEGAYRSGVQRIPLALV